MVRYLVNVAGNYQVSVALNGMPIKDSTGAGRFIAGTAAPLARIAPFSLLLAGSLVEFSRYTPKHACRHVHGMHHLRAGAGGL